MADATVAVVGINALVRNLKTLSDDQRGPLLAVLKDAGRQAAAPVADAARSAVPHDTGTLSGDIRVSATRTGAGIRMGRKTVPYAGPVEFGGWPPGREFVPNGRYLFPAARSLSESAARLYTDALQRGLDDYGWTNTTTDAAAVHD